MGFNAVKYRPILFKGEMVRSLLSGTKTQTRRVLKQATGPSLSVGMDDDEPGVAALSWLWGDGPGHDVHETIKRVRCPYGQPGDRLYLRETWQAVNGNDRARHIVTHPAPDRGWIEYAATPRIDEPAYKWRPSIHMPRWASRITLEVTGVRVERLQDISEADAKAEGADCLITENCTDQSRALLDMPLMEDAKPYRNGYALLWESINGDGSWDANPFVWVVSFRRISDASQP